MVVTCCAASVRFVRWSTGCRYSIAVTEAEDWAGAVAVRAEDQGCTGPAEQKEDDTLAVVSPEAVELVMQASRLQGTFRRSCGSAGTSWRRGPCISVHNEQTKSARRMHCICAEASDIILAFKRSRDACA